MWRLESCFAATFFCLNWHRGIHCPSSDKVVKFTAVPWWKLCREQRFNIKFHISFYKNGRLIIAVLDDMNNFLLFHIIFKVFFSKLFFFIRCQWQAVPGSLWWEIHFVFQAIVWFTYFWHHCTYTRIHFPFTPELLAEEIVPRSLRFSPPFC